MVNCRSYPLRTLSVPSPYISTTLAEMVRRWWAEDCIFPGNAHSASGWRALGLFKPHGHLFPSAQSQAVVPVYAFCAPVGCAWPHALAPHRGCFGPMRWRPIGGVFGPPSGAVPLRGMGEFGCA